MSPPMLDNRRGSRPETASEVTPKASEEVPIATSDSPSSSPRIMGEAETARRARRSAGGGRGGGEDVKARTRTLATRVVEITLWSRHL